MKIKSTRGRKHRKFRAGGTKGLFLRSCSPRAGTEELGRPEGPGRLGPEPAVHLDDQLASGQGQRDLGSLRSGCGELSSEEV